MNKLVTALVAACLPVLAWAGPVNINTADAAQLADELDGVGLAKAEAIVQYRSQNGDFAAAEELLKVKGIGNRILDANAGNIQVSD